jgi:glutamate-1-semialdehyde 2,1-aminomutase
MQSYSTSKSEEMFERAHRSLPGGVSANARSTLAGYKPYPVFMERGEGARLYDVDGNEYIDYLCGFGPLVLGHRPPSVIEAVKKVLDTTGPLLGAPYPLEQEVANRLVTQIPSMELVRFASTGGEAVREALRLARVYTGKSKVIRFEGQFHGYHGCIHFSHKPPLEIAGPEERPEPVPGTGGIAEGLGTTLIVQPWNRPDVLEQTILEHKDDIAAIITEPVMGNCGVIPPQPGYLEFLRDITQQNDIVLIFDEVKTGFRLALGGAQEYFGITPDVTVFAKALGGGFACIAGIGGRREMMELIAQGRLWQSGTYASNVVAIAATNAVLDELEQPGFYERLFANSERLKRGLKDILTEAGASVTIQGVGPMFQVFFSDSPITNYREAIRFARPEEYTAFYHAMLHNGVFFHPNQFENWFVSGAHTEQDIDATLDRTRAAMSAFHAAL